MLHQRKRSRRPMSRTQRACWLFLAMMKSTSGFSTSQPSCTSSVQSNSPRILSAPPLHLVTEDDEGMVMTSKNKKSRFRRAVRRILGRPRTENDEAAASMHMLTKEAQETELSEEFVKGLRLGDVNADFILKNFETTGPNDIFPADASVQRRNVLTTSEEEQGTSVETESTVADPPKRTIHKDIEQPQVVQVKTAKLKSPKKNSSRMSSKYEGGTLAHRMTRSWFQNLLTGIIHRRSKVPPVGLSVRVAPRSVMKRLCKGQVHCDASIDFHRVVFRNIRLTGGSLEAKRMTLGVYGGGPRYASQFDIHANNCTLTEDDLFESSCIRNGLARLLVRILSNAGVKTSKIQVTSLDIVPSGKISCSGHADTVFGSKVSFEVRSGIGTSSRGHIVTFPGLEVSLGPSLGVFMPVVPEIDLDIGHNARLRDIFVDGRRRRVTLSASTTVTPTHTMKLHKYRQHSDSYSAHFSFDVGRWVTNLGNFTN